MEFKNLNIGDYFIDNYSIFWKIVSMCHISDFLSTSQIIISQDSKKYEYAKFPFDSIEIKIDFNDYNKLIPLSYKWIGNPDKNKVLELLYF